jgi:hypothetical protein
MMIRRKTAIGMMLFTMATAASAGDATLANAVVAYNALPSKDRVLAVAPVTLAPGAQVTQLPAWLAEAGLTGQEAAATAAAFGVYGERYSLNYQTRRWGTAAKVAAGVTDALLRSPGGLPDALPHEPPARDLTEARRTALLRMMGDMGTCSGALVRAAQKTAKLRLGDDATRLLAKAKQDLGAAALPPDDSCLS